MIEFLSNRPWEDRRSSSVRLRMERYEKGDRFTSPFSLTFSSSYNTISYELVCRRSVGSAYAVWSVPFCQARFASRTNSLEN